MENAIANVAGVQITDRLKVAKDIIAINAVNTATLTLPLDNLYAA